MSSNENRAITKENGRHGADQLIIAALAGGCLYEEATRAAGDSKVTVTRLIGLIALRTCSTPAAPRLGLCDER
jgi:hypothetical protein